MRLTARADYAVRACLELARAGVTTPIDVLAARQDVSAAFLERILAELRRAGVVTSTRGARGGYRLARPADAVTLGDVVRAVDGPLVWVRGERPSELTYPGAAAALVPVWVALRASVREVLDRVTLADVVGDRLPAHVVALTETEHAWRSPAAE
jgi:Rrf2 family protein